MLGRSGTYKYRMRDVFVAGAGLLMLAPFLTLVAVAVPLDSKGPVFFRQERVGKDGRTFYIHKFRSMRTENSGLQISTADDSRITRVGYFLRKSKVDELPQLIDVLRGEMSLVGPRPEVPKYVKLWPKELRAEILSVRPGVTDPATIALRHEAELLTAATDPEQLYIAELLPLKTKMYVDYIRNRTFLGDIRIILDTLRAIANR